MAATDLDAGRAGVLPGRRPVPAWLWCLAGLVVVFAIVASVRSHVVGVPFRDPHGSYFWNRLGLLLAILLVLALVEAVFRGRHAGWGPRTTFRMLRERWTSRRILLAGAALVAYQTVYLCYRNLKSWNAFNTPQDTMLLRWDRALFFGHDPAVLLHDLLGQHYAAYVLMAIYESFSMLTTIALVAALVFTPSIREGAVYIASACWVWILGVGSYYLIPTIGPFHSAPQDFAGLPHTMVQETQATYVGQRAHLLADPLAHDAFAQLAAFASLHVAVTALVFLMARYYGLRRISWAVGVFLMATMVATVYLGWHFAIDDLAGLLIACLGVQAGRLLVHPLGDRRPSPGPEHRQPSRVG